MTKLQLLHRALNERMMAAVEQIMEMVGGTVLEYEEETTRVRKENEVLRRRLQWMEESNRADWPGTWDPVTLSTPDESNPSQQEESVVSFDFGQESQAVVIKTESTDNSLFVRPQSSLATMTRGTEQGSAIDETSASTHFDQGNRAGSWDSTQSYMAPLEFDPSSSTRVRCYEVKGKRQRMSFACPDCGKVFGRKQGLIFHMRVHSTETPYVYRSRKECFYGDIRKYKRRGLPKLSRENTDDLSDGSEQANRSSPSAEHPDKSDQTSRDKGPENITSKPVPFPRKRKQKNKMARCPLCGQGFSQNDQLALHLKSHVKEARQSPVTYPNKAQSGDGERQKNKMRKHIGATKKATVVFPCPECDRVFARPSWLDNHIKSHVCETALLHKQLEVNVSDQTELPKEETKMGVPEDGGSTEVPSKKLKKAIPCPYCDKVFSAEGWLRSHVRGIHCKRKTSYFDVVTGVGRTRSQRTLANQHLRKTRKTKRDGFGSHKCKLCDKSYCSKSWLWRHMRLHLEEGLATSRQQSITDEMQDNENTDEQNCSSMCLRLTKTRRFTLSSPDRFPQSLDGVVLPDVILNHVSLEKQQQLYVNSVGADGRPKPARFAALLFKSLIPLETYQNWTGSVNFDGSRGKYALPENLRQTILNVVGRNFQLTIHDWKMIKDRLNELLRNRRVSFSLKNH